MCGIVGYTGSDIAKNILVTGLKRMEYRGYDSSGVALEVGEGAAAHLDVIRRVGKVAGLESELSNIDSDATCGIGHTRWATHGKPSVVNAHPHTSCDGRIAIVHNGIIENFAELREELEDRGHHFKSETDTEVFAHLIEEAYAETHDLMASVREACTHVVGAYGLAAVCADEPGVIAVARKDSPIVVGVGETGSYVASDVIALIDATRDVVVLEDGQFAKLTPAGVEYTDEAGNVIEPKVTHIDWDLDMAEKGGYPDFMLKEIHEQPRVVRDTLVGRMAPAGELDIDELGLSLEELNDIDRAPENRAVIEENARTLGIPIHIFESQIFDSVYNVEKSPCYLCARMRRGHLYHYAQELGCNKVALGHHLDDAVETFYMNLWREGRIGCFSPVTQLDRRGLTLIRPMLLATEHEVRCAVKEEDFPIVKSRCPADGVTVREQTKDFVRERCRTDHAFRQKTLHALQESGIDGWRPVHTGRTSNPSPKEGMHHADAEL